MFTLNNGSGFSVELDNGWTVSVQWGSGNYGSNRHKKLELTYSFNSRLVARTVEVRAWNGETDWKFPDGEEVRGYCKPEEVLRFMEAVSQLPDRKAMEVWGAQYCTVPEKSFPVKSSKAYKILKASGYFALAEQDDRS